MCPPEYDLVMTDALPGQIIAFTLGMWAAKLVSNNQIKVSTNLLTIFVITLLYSAAWLGDKFTRYNPASDLIFSFGFFLLILLTSRAGNIAGNFCRWKPFVWIGQISYSIYLLHYPIMKLAYSEFGLIHIRDRVLFIAGLALLPIVIAVSAVFHKYCERPFMNTPQTGKNTIRVKSPAIAEPVIAGIVEKETPTTQPASLS
jgi:peptidoglycan/LPS O-acetylase OafA/YrhL